MFYQLSLTNDDNLDIQHDVNDSVVKEEVKKVSNETVKAMSDKNESIDKSLLEKITPNTTDVPLKEIIKPENQTKSKLEDSILYFDEITSPEVDKEYKKYFKERLLSGLHEVGKSKDSSLEDEVRLVIEHYENDLDVMEASYEALAQINSESSRAFLEDEYMNAKDPFIKRRLIYALGQINSKDYIGHIESDLKSRYPIVVKSAVSALAQMKSEGSITVISQLYNDGGRELKLEILNYMKRLGTTEAQIFVDSLSDSETKLVSVIFKEQKQ